MHDMATAVLESRDSSFQFLCGVKFGAKAGHPRAVHLRREVQPPALMHAHQPQWLPNLLTESRSPRACLIAPIVPRPAENFHPSLLPIISLHPHASSELLFILMLMLMLMHLLR